jgi:hypothetical protein
VRADIHDEEINPFESGSTHAEEPLRLEFNDYASFLAGIVC